MHKGGAKKLEELIIQRPETRLVVVDTLAKIRKPVRSQNVYEDYAALEALRPVVDKYGIAIVVVHHLGKEAAADPLDENSSSTDLTAGVDGFLILRRTPGSRGPTLYVDGRDIEEPTEYALHWNLNTATWTIEGDAEEEHISNERADILLVLDFEQINAGTLYRTLRQMEKEGLCESEWDSSERGGPARRMYHITEAGEAHLEAWLEAYKGYQRVIDALSRAYRSSRKAPRCSKPGDEELSSSS